MVEVQAATAAPTAAIVIHASPDIL
jgi:hypothetical protein